MARKLLDLPKVSPMATEGQEAIAERIDWVLNELAVYLRNFEAKDVENVDDVPSEQVSSNRMMGVFIQTFDRPIEDYWTFRDGDSSDISYPTNGTTGGKVFQATGHKRLEFPENIPYDYRRVYRLRARVRVTSKDGAEDTFRWGLQGFDSDGTVVDRTGGNSPNKPHIVGADKDLGGETLDEFVEIEAYLTGRGASGSGSPGTHDDTAQMHNDVVAVRPFFEVNYDGGDGTQEVDFIAFDVLTVEDEIDAILTRNGPIEADAEQTAGKDFSLLASRFFENLLRSGTNNTDLSVIVSKVDDAGDLEQFTLMDDGAEKRTIAKGKQEGSARDGDAVSFDPAFQNTPTVFFRPTGVSWDINKFGAPQVQALDTTSLSSQNDVSSGTSFDFAPGGGIVDVILKVDWDSGSSTTRAVVVAVETHDGNSWSEEVRTIFTGRGFGGAAYDSRERIRILNTDIDDGYQIRLKIVDESFATGDSVEAIEMQYRGSKEIFQKMVADELSASGFTLIAKMVERNITVSETTDAFPAGTITTEGGTHALGGLSDDADDDEYRAFTDITLQINSADTLQGQDDNFPAGVIDAVGESKEVTLSAEPSSSLDVRYDISLEVTADAGTTEESVSLGTVSTNGGTSSETLEFDANDDEYRLDYFPNIDPSNELTLYFDSNDGGAGWVTEDSVALTSSSPAGQLSFTNADITDGDQVRMRISVTTDAGGSHEVSGTLKYDRNEDANATSGITVVLETHDGNSWTTRDTSSYSITDTDGTGETLSQNVEKTFSASSAEKVRARVSAVDESGDASSRTHECDPNDVQYDSGSAETATIQVTVALDSKDGTDAWVERDTDQYSLTDSTGTGQSKTFSDERLSFNGSNIVGGDDIRLRIKSVTVTGNTDSHSVTVDPNNVKFNIFTGDTTEHTKTPLTSDAIDWVAITG